MLKVLPYVRVSTGEQPYSADAQEHAILKECQRRGYVALPTLSDIGESRATSDRPALSYALAMLKRGDADVLMASRLDRLCGSTAQLAKLTGLATRQGWSVVFVDDSDLDMTTSEGAFKVAAACLVAERETQLISIRTKDGMAAKRAKGLPVGRPSILDFPDLLAKIHRLRHDEKLSLSAICRQLEADGIPTVRGGKKWRPSAIQVALGYRRPAQRAAA